MDRYLAKKVIWWSNTQFITQTDEIVLKCHYFLLSLKIAIDSNLCNPATLIYLNVQDLCVLATLLVLHSLTKACCGWSCIQGSKVNPKSSSKDRSFQALNTRRVTLIADLYGRGESRCCNFNLLETGYKREALQLFFFCFSCKGKCFFFLNRDQIHPALFQGLSLTDRWILFGDHCVAQGLCKVLLADMLYPSYSQEHWSIETLSLPALTPYLPSLCLNYCVVELRCVDKKELWHILFSTKKLTSLKGKNTEILFSFI